MLGWLLLSLLLPTPGLPSLQPPKPNYRKLEKKIMDKLFSPSQYDSRMRPMGGNSTHKSV